MARGIWSHISNKVTRNKVNQITLEASSCWRFGLILECVAVMLEGKRRVSFSSAPPVIITALITFCCSRQRVTSCLSRMSNKVEVKWALTMTSRYDGTGSAFGEGGKIKWMCFNPSLPGSYQGIFYINGSCCRCHCATIDVRLGSLLGNLVLDLFFFSICFWCLLLKLNVFRLGLHRGNAVNSLHSPQGLPLRRSRMPQ